MNGVDNEFHNPAESGQPDEFGTRAVSEFFETGKEVFDDGKEDFKDSNGEMSAEDERKHKQKKKVEKMIKKMSAMVTGTVAVAALSGTLGNTMESNVIKAGGNVNGDLRFSIQWNDQNNNHNDLDAHSIEPNGYEIYYGNSTRVSPAGGCLDVDVITPGDKVAVENIIYENRKDMEEGVYQLKVVCFANRGGTGGFNAEVEIRGKVYEFQYDGEMRAGESVVVAEVSYEKGRLRMKKGER